MESTIKNNIKNSIKTNNKPAQIACLKDVLVKLEQAGVHYCILRNYEFLLGSSDPVESLDTVVTKKDLPLFESVLKQNGFQKRTQQFSLKHKAYFKLVNLEKVSFDLQVGGVHWNDMPYLGEEIVQNRIKTSFFYVPSDDDSAVMFLAHSILGKRYFKPKYQKILQDIYPQINKDYVFQKLSFIFSRKSSSRMVEAMKVGNFSSLHWPSYILGYLFRRPKNIFIFSALALRWIRQRKNPFKLAPLISIIGPDGSGKSTMVDYLNDYLLASGRKVQVIYSGRGRNNFLPISWIGRKYKRYEKEKDKEIKDKGVINLGKRGEKRSEQVSFLRRSLYLLSAPVFAADFYLRYLTKMLPARLRGKIVITDRYCSDIILMKNVPFWFKKFFYILFPKPSVSILLYNSPEVLHQRRPEEPVPELERQMEIFNRLKYTLKVKTEIPESDRRLVAETSANYLLRNWF
jgi:thymidylate kinase